MGIDIDKYFQDSMTSLLVDNPAQEGFFKETTSKLHIPIPDRLSIEVYRYRAKPVEIKQVYSKEDFVYMRSLFGPANSYTVASLFGAINFEAIAKDISGEIKLPENRIDAVKCEVSFNRKKKDYIAINKMAIGFINEMKKIYSKMNIPNEKSLKSFREFLLNQFEIDLDELKEGIKAIENLSYSDLLAGPFQYDKYGIWPVIIPNMEDLNMWKEYHKMRATTYRVYTDLIEKQLKKTPAKPVSTVAEEGVSEEIDDIENVIKNGKLMLAKKTADEYNEIRKLCDKIRNTIAKVCSIIKRDLQSRKTNSDEYGMKKCEEVTKKAEKINNDAAAIEITDSPKTALASLIRYLSNIESLANQNKIEVAMASLDLTDDDYQLAMETFMYEDEILLLAEEAFTVDTFKDISLYEMTGIINGIGAAPQVTKDISKLADLPKIDKRALNEVNNVIRSNIQKLRNRSKVEDILNNEVILTIQADGVLGRICLPVATEDIDKLIEHKDFKVAIECTKVFAQKYKDFLNDVDEIFNAYENSAIFNNLKAALCHECDMLDIQNTHPRVCYIISTKSDVGELDRYLDKIRELISEYTKLLYYKRIISKVSQVEENDEIVEDATESIIRDAADKVIKSTAPNSKKSGQVACRERYGEYIKAINELDSLRSSKDFIASKQFSSQIRKYVGAGGKRGSEEYIRLNDQLNRLILKYSRKLGNLDKMITDFKANYKNLFDSAKGYESTISQMESLINRIKEDTKKYRDELQALAADINHDDESLNEIKKTLSHRAQDLTELRKANDDHRAEAIKREKIERENRLEEEMKQRAGKESYSGDVSLEVEALEGLSLSNEDLTNMAWWGIGYVAATISAYLFTTSLKGEKDELTAGSKMYQLIANDKFMKTEKPLKTFLKNKKKFSVDKEVLREIVEFRNEYYRSIAFVVNSFMDIADDMDELQKNQKYYLSSTVPNENRDNVMVNALANKFAKIDGLHMSDYMAKTSKMQDYKAKYLSGIEKDEKMIIDSAYLIKILNPTEMYKMYETLVKINEKVMTKEEIETQVDKYRKKIPTYYESPVAKYINLMSSYSYMANEILSFLKAYIVQVYAVLDFCIIIDEKKGK